MAAVLILVLGIIVRPHSHAQHTETAAAAGAGLRQAAHLGAGVELVADAAALTSRDAAAVSAVAQREQAFSIALLQQVNSTDGTNVAISPASLAIVLSMLQNGARGQTAAEIAATLRSTGLTAAIQNAGWSGLLADWTQAATQDKITFTSADSVWLQNGLPMLAPFMTDLARYYDTGVWQVDYAGDLAGATAAINAWTKQQTHGKIPELFEKDQLDASTLLVLANAVYFNAAWQQPFDAQATQPAPFTLSSGKTVTTPFMHGGTGATAAIGTGYQAVQLPYTSGRFAALAVMPTRGSLSSFTRRLHVGSLQSIVASLRTPQTLELSMPRFGTTTSTDLAAPLKALISMDDVAARAATGVVTINLDHPFLFLVRDTVTGAILFAAQVNNPAS